MNWILVICFWVVLGANVFSQTADNELPSQQSLREKLDSATVQINEEKIKKAFALLEPINQFDTTPLLKAEAWRLQGLGFSKNKNNVQAREALENALKLNRTIYNRLGMAQCLYLLGRMDAFDGQFEATIKKAEEAAFYAKTLGNIPLEYRLSNLLSWAYSSTDFDFRKVLQHEERLMELANHIDDDLDKAHVYNNVGYDLTVAGTVSIDSVIALMRFANDVFARTENTNGRWYTLMNLTWQYRLKNDLETSRQYGEKSVRQALADNDRHAVIETCFQLAETWMALGQRDSTSHYFKIAKDWCGDATDRDKYVFDVYYSNFLLKNNPADKTALQRLEAAVDFLQTGEVFYEMHGRAILAAHYLDTDRKTDAAAQLELIENPRHNYIAAETRAMAVLVRARLLEMEGRKVEAVALRKAWGYFD